MTRKPRSHKPQEQTTIRATPQIISGSLSIAGEQVRVGPTAVHSTQGSASPTVAIDRLQKAARKGVFSVPLYANE